MHVWRSACTLHVLILLNLYGGKDFYTERSKLAQKRCVHVYPTGDCSQLIEDVYVLKGEQTK